MQRSDGDIQTKPAYGKGQALRDAANRLARCTDAGRYPHSRRRSDEARSHKKGQALRDAANRLGAMC